MTAGSLTSRLLGYLAVMVRLGLLAVGLVMLAAVAYVVASGKWATLSPAGLGLYLVTPLVIAIGCAAAAIRMPASRMPLLVREGGLLIFTILLAELLLTGFFPPANNLIEKQKSVAEKLGRSFDERTITQVVADLASEGTQAYPAFPVHWIRRPQAKAHIPEAIYPLSHMSDSSIVECNESGEYLVYRSDEFGFQNPQGLHSQQPVQVAAVGSSFALGRCVPIGLGMVDQLRQRYPHSLNFGMTGAGGLSMLGTFREFVEPIKPRVVLWVVYPQALDIREEITDPILSRYLDPAFSQGLRGRQAEVDAILKRATPIVQREFDERLAATTKRNAKNLSWGSVAKLFQIRTRFLPPSEAAQKDGPADLEAFMEILRLVKTRVEQWGGHFYVVYIPHFIEVVERGALAGIRLRDVAPLLEQDGIALIEGMTPFSAHRDPASLYTLRINNHFSEEGHRIMGDLIAQRLRADLGENF